MGNMQWNGEWCKKTLIWDSCVSKNKILVTLFQKMENPTLHLPLRFPNVCLVEDFLSKIAHPLLVLSIFLLSASRTLVLLLTARNSSLSAARRPPFFRLSGWDAQGDDGDRPRYHQFHSWNHLPPCGTVIYFKYLPDECARIVTPQEGKKRLDVYRPSVKRIKVSKRLSWWQWSLKSDNIETIEMLFDLHYYSCRILM